MNQEVELKLELPQEALAAFERLSLLPEASKTTKLRATYFDTPDRQLQAHGLSLRVRRAGNKRTQTVKADGGEGGSGLFSRAEWEMPVSSDCPVIDARTPVAAVLGDAVEALEPAFHVDVDRRTWQLSEGGSATEMVLDNGAVRAGERQAQVCEIELEQKKGQPAALFTLARRIDAAVPVRLGVLAKAERGYRLLDAAQGAFKAEPLTLKAAATAGEAFPVIGRACVRHYRLNEELLLDHYDPRALHQARVAIRRLRSALSIFKPILNESDVTRFQEELRWLAGVLGEARNLDVLIERTDEGALHDQMQAARGVVHAQVREALGSGRVRTLMLDVVEWLALGSGLDEEAAGESGRRFAAGRLQHFHRRVVKGGRDMEKLDDVARHEVRKSAKKLRYATEFFVGLFTETKKERRSHANFIKALEGLQDELGVLNDLVHAPEIMRQHGLAAEAAQADGGKRKKKLIAAAADAHDDLADTDRFWR